MLPEEGDFPENLHRVVYVIINKCSFESFVCFDLGGVANFVVSGLVYLTVRRMTITSVTACGGTPQTTPQSTEGKLIALKCLFASVLSTLYVVESAKEEKTAVERNLLQG